MFMLDITKSFVCVTSHKKIQLATRNRGMNNSMVQHSMDQNHHEKEEEGSPNGINNLRSLRDELESYNVDNERLIRKKEE